MKLGSHSSLICFFTGCFMLKKRESIYPISVAAKLLDIHPRTIRIYEEEGLIRPSRRGNKRYFSDDDINWIRCIRDLIHDQGISIPGIKRLLQLVPCWQIKNCPEEVRASCSAYVDHALPCWELSNNACSQGQRQCEQCVVYRKAMSVLSGSSSL